MLRAKATIAALSEEFRLLDRNTTSPSASSASATYIIGTSGNPPTLASSLS